MKWLFDKFFKNKSTKPTVTFVYPDYPPEMVNPVTKLSITDYVNNCKYDKIWNSLHPKEQYIWIDYPNTYSLQKTAGYFCNAPLAPMPEVLRRSGFEIKRKLLKDIDPKEKYVYLVSAAMSSLQTTLPKWGANLFENVNDKIVEDINNDQCLFIISDVDENSSRILEPWFLEKLDILLAVAGIDPTKVLFVTRNSADKTVGQLMSEVNFVTWDYYSTGEKFRMDDEQLYPVPCDVEKYNSRFYDSYYQSLIDYLPKNPFVDRFKDNMKRLSIDPTFGGQIEIIYGGQPGTGYPDSVMKESCTMPMKLLNCFSNKKPFIYISNDRLLQKIKEQNYGTFFGWSDSYADYDNETRRLNELNKLFSEIEKNKDSLPETIEKYGRETLEGNFDTLSKAFPEIDLILQISKFYDVNFYESIRTES